MVMRSVGCTGEIYERVGKSNFSRFGEPADWRFHSVDLLPGIAAMIEQHPLSLISITTAEHYIWGEQCDGWFLLKSDNFHVIQESMPPGATEVRHYHRKSRQLFYVLRGELTMQTGSSPVRIPAGHAVVVEPAAEHQARNESREPVEFLVVSCPPSHGDRFDCK